MALDWQSVPERFHYLKNSVLENRTNELGVAQFDPGLGRHVTLAEKLNPDELIELARVHHEICRRDDNLPIIDWITETRKSKRGRDAAWTIQSLLVLLQELADLEVKPFSEKRLCAEKPPAPLDWTILPPDLAYLGEAVEKYAELGTEAAILEWLDQASDADLRKLDELAQRMFRDADTISAWSKQYRKSREESRVFWLYLLFDHAGIEPE